MKDTLNAALKSPKTTVGGVLAVIVLLASALFAQFDGDPETVAQWTPVVSAIMVAIALFTARDNDVTSKKAGASDE